MVQRRKEKSSLSFSKSERQTFSYRIQLNVFLRAAQRSTMSSLGAARSIAMRNRPTKNSSEYWYLVK